MSHAQIHPHRHPGTGKTAILRQLELNGYVVVEEAATDVIALENALGHAEPWHEPAFLDKIVTLQRHRQARTQAADGATFFCDRSARRISFGESLVFEKVHEQIYHDLGFRLAEVPAGALTDRVALVQQTIERLHS